MSECFSPAVTDLRSTSPPWSGVDNDEASRSSTAPRRGITSAANDGISEVMAGDATTACVTVLIVMRPRLGCRRLNSPSNSRADSQVVRGTW